MFVSLTLQREIFNVPFPKNHYIFKMLFLPLSFCCYVLSVYKTVITVRKYRNGSKNTIFFNRPIAWQSVTLFQLIMCLYQISQLVAVTNRSRWNQSSSPKGVRQSLELLQVQYFNMHADQDVCIFHIRVDYKLHSHRCENPTPHNIKDN
jgi:hypothetical protein